MQQRNFILFMVLSLVIMIGWMWIQQQIWPPGDPPQAETKKALWKWKKESPDKQSEILTSLLSTPTMPDIGVAQAARLAIDLNVADKRTKMRLASVVPYAALTSEQQRIAKCRAALMQSFTTVAMTPVIGLQSLDDKALISLIEEPKTVAPDTKNYVLGNNDFFLQASVTNIGGGIRKVALTQFKAADEYGRPTGKTMQLVQDDPYWPSFVMYHYPAGKTDHPLRNLGEAIWKAGKLKKTEDAHEISFSTTAPAPFAHLSITKTYRLEKRAYHIGLTISIQDNRTANSKVPAFRYQLTGAHGVPVEGIWYTRFTRTAMIAQLDSEGHVTRDRDDAIRVSNRAGGDAVPQSKDGANFYYAGVANQYFASLIVVDNDQPAPSNGGVNKKNILAWARPTLETEAVKGVIASIKNDKLVLQAGPKFMAFRLLPRTLANVKERRMAKGDKVVVRFYSYLGKDYATRIRPGSVIRAQLDDMTVRVNSMPIELGVGTQVVHQFMLYHGPAKIKALGQMGRESVSDDLLNKYYQHRLDTLTDYGTIWFFSDLLLFFTNIMHWLLHVLSFVGPGLSIILLTVLVRGALFPLSKKQALMSIKMQEMAPEMKEIQKKYKSDPKARTEATMKLYRERGVNPLGMCLPMLAQLPIFLGLYWGLQESVHFRLASFLWIKNLAAPDMLIWWGEGIPVISNPDNTQGLFSFFYLGPYFNLMPVLAVSMMIIHQKLFSPPPVDEQQAFSYKMMRIMMVVIGLLFYKVAAGLCIYFTVSSLWGFAERKLLPKKKDPNDPANSVVRTKPDSPKKGGGPSGKKKPKQRVSKEPPGVLQKAKNWWSEVLKKARKD